MTETEELVQLPYINGVRLGDRVRTHGGGSTKIDCHHFEKGRGNSSVEMSRVVLRQLGCRYFMEVYDEEGVHVFGATDALTSDAVPDQPPYVGPTEPVDFDSVAEGDMVVVAGKHGLHEVRSCLYSDLVVVARADGARAPFSVTMAHIVARAPKAGTQ